ncbi:MULTISPECIES: hypothetical protein [unclassified Clostridium]|uniref:hypothetical protein n=1 Tax=unclassified Clostridium TaxID=2614128 RepID=UPI0005FADC88|nr:MULTISPECIES: hypothetical protein [unclassified Clostridium]KJZ83939.1 hypothetical protein ClosIBUN125C_CONTIG68g03830 [Clostridium sp. IBUN125C]KJZ90017.1 hypothetical protein ClosIBUN22A_CONTIG200g04034 [Clostridium sp. IBUN22A]KJZ92296.1 hypothetical protein ClosIBUN13A_CONTIG22g00291 [Clostridium sp. IBUN13A]KJZ93420.1 hypothetical protein ClosIBUN62F_CONTIG43g01554 [Clostridium sp. IBUN62F]MDU1232537.1 hypothetical protein [Clostridium sp.]
MNKILSVYNKKTGDLLFTQYGVQEEYACLTALVANNKEVIGVDLSTNSFILADRQATTEEKEQLKRELNEKNRELENTKQELLKTQATVVDVTYNNLLK